jgi:hypothetical protein
VSREFDLPARAFTDAGTPDEERLAAGAEMLDVDPFGAREILIEGAAESNAEPRFLEGVGKLLARCALLTTQLTEWDFRDMTDIAYDAYWAGLP